MKQEQLLIVNGIIEQMLVEDNDPSHTYCAYMTQSERDHLIKTMAILRAYILTLDRAILHP